MHHTRPRPARDGSAHQLSRPPRHTEIHQQALGNPHRTVPLMSCSSEDEILGWEATWVAAKSYTSSFLDDVSAPFWEVAEYNATLIEFPQLSHAPQIQAPE